MALQRPYWVSRTVPHRTGEQTPKNTHLIAELYNEPGLSGTNEIEIHTLTSEFTYKESKLGKISEIASTLDPRLSKVWACEKLIGPTGQTQELFVSRTGAKLVFDEAEPWSSLYPEDADEWLDVKGAFIGPTGPYQLKSPEDRAAKLEERGTA